MHTSLIKITLGALALAAAFSAQAQTRAVIDTDMGQIGLSLDEQKAPKTVANFVSYAEKGFYDNTVFHRVIKDFMIQGGGYNADLSEKRTDKAIINEAANGLHNNIGTIAMARTMDPNSATSQFFINTADNESLNFKSRSAQGYGYAVFGKVTSGMDVVNKINAVPTGARGLHQDVPLQPVLIRKVTILK